MSEVFQFKPAERKNVSAKIAVVGASGSGKTWSALLFLRGLVGPEGRIAAIDTENDSMSMYEGLIKTDLQPKGFDVMNLTAPFTTHRYLKGMEVAEKAGYHGLIIDQASWMWDGTGGLLEMHAQLAKGKKGGEWAAWDDVTELYREFIERLLLSDMHIVVTLRAKTVYGDEEGEGGKRKKVKIGTAPIQRPGLEYEFYTVFDLDQANNATVSKDRTGIFKDHKLPLAIEDGVKLREFLGSGRPMTPDEKRQVVVGPPRASGPQPTSGGNGKPTPPAQPPKEPVLTLAQRQEIYRTVETLKIPKEKVVALLRELAGVEESTHFPASKHDELVKRIAALAAGAPELPPLKEPALSQQQVKIIESTATNVGLTADELKEAISEVHPGCETLDCFPALKFTALMRALIGDEGNVQKEPDEPVLAGPAK